MSHGHGSCALVYPVGYHHESSPLETPTPDVPTSQALGEPISTNTSHDALTALRAPATARDALSVGAR